MPDLPTKYLTTLLVTLCLFTTRSKAQIIERVLGNFGKYQNISYTAFLQNKDLFGDEIFLDTLYATETLKNKATFRLKGNIQEDIYDGQKVFKLNHKDSTYRISDKANDCFYYDKSLPYLMGHLKTLVQKGKNEVQLKDSIYNGKSYFQIQFTEADAIINGKRVYIINRLLVDKKTYLIYWYRKDVEAFIDGTTTFIKFFSEYRFDNIKINASNFSDLTAYTLPPYFNLEKPKKDIPLLGRGTKAPNIVLADLNGKTSNLKDHEGKIVLLNFTINGCPHCVSSIDMLNELTKQYPTSEFAVMAVNALDDTASILKYNDKFKQYYETYKIDKTATIVYPVNGYPTFYLINKEGNIVKGFSGYSKEIEKKIKVEITALIP